MRVRGNEEEFVQILNDVYCSFMELERGSRVREILEQAVEVAMKRLD